MKKDYKKLLYLVSVLSFVYMGLFFVIFLENKTQENQPEQEFQQEIDYVLLEVDSSEGE